MIHHGKLALTQTTKSEWRNEVLLPPTTGAQAEGEGTNTIAEGDWGKQSHILYRLS
jgi:hypothetical protein